MTLVLRGRVVTGDADLPDAVVGVEGERIVLVRPATVADEEPATDQVIVPGLVDLHCHGGGGASFTAGEAAQVEQGARHHLAQGTTSLVGSAVTDTPEAMLRAVTAMADGVETGLLAAIHAEGPFLSAARCGAQDPAHLRTPDLALTEELVAAGRGHLRMMTVAPELPGADEVAALLTSLGVVAAVGHTEADARTTERFLRAQPRGHVTHLFNGMPPTHHRDAGPVAGSLAAAAAGAAVVELIGDGVHVADDMVSVILRVLGAGRVALTTDAMAAAGMPDGDYLLGPQRVRVEHGVARLGAGDSIAGGTSRLLDIVRRQVSAGLDPVTVVASASSVPASVLGLDDELGAIRAGLRADLVVTDRDLRPLMVIRAGARV